MAMVDRFTERAMGWSGLARSVGENVTEAAESAIDYVRRRGLRRIGRDVTRCVSRNPVQSMVALTAFGFLTGMLARRR
jgi:hypothetical protein